MGEGEREEEGKKKERDSYCIALVDLELTV